MKIVAFFKNGMIKVYNDVEWPIENHNALFIKTNSVVTYDLSDGSVKSEVVIMKKDLERVEVIMNG